MAWYVTYTNFKQILSDKENICKEINLKVFLTLMPGAIPLINTRYWLLWTSIYLSVCLDI